MGRITLIGGGVRSGKTRWAITRARQLPSPRIYVATAETRDAEMATRAARHQEERGADFETLEEPLALDDALSRCRHARVVVVDCLTLWLSNRLLTEESPGDTLAALDGALDRAAEAPYETLLVTNEVGMGIVPETPLGRAFRDLAGSAHQVAAGKADEVYLAALGVLLRLRPGPVETVDVGG